MNTQTDYARLRAAVDILRVDLHAHGKMSPNGYTFGQQGEIYMAREVSEKLDAILAQHPALEQPAAGKASAPDGWVLVPRVPTAAMRDALLLHWSLDTPRGWVKGWQDAIDSAPAAPAAPETPESEQRERNAVSAEPVAWIDPRHLELMKAARKDSAFQNCLKLAPTKFDTTPLYTHPTPAASDGGLREALLSNGCEIVEQAIDVLDGTSSGPWVRNVRAERAEAVADSAVVMLMAVRLTSAWGFLSDSTRQQIEAVIEARPRAAQASTPAAAAPEQAKPSEGAGAEVTPEDVAVLERIRRALPDIGVNGWATGVATLDRVIPLLARRAANDARDAKFREFVGKRWALVPEREGGWLVLTYSEPDADGFQGETLIATGPTAQDAIDAALSTTGANEGKE